MTVTWTIEATRSLKQIFSYRKETGSLASAKKLRVQIFNQTKLLGSLPRLGTITKQRKIKEHEIRTLIKGHFQVYSRIREPRNEIQIIYVSDSRSIQKPPFIE